MTKASANPFAGLKPAPKATALETLDGQMIYIPSIPDVVAKQRQYSADGFYGSAEMFFPAHLSFSSSERKFLAENDNRALVTVVEGEVQLSRLV